jgi:putative transposase
MPVWWCRSAGASGGKRAGDSSGLVEIATAVCLRFWAVRELFSRKLLACPTSTHPDAELACDAIKIAMTVRGGGAVVGGVVFHTDLGSTHTHRNPSTAFTLR